MRHLLAWAVLLVVVRLCVRGIVRGFMSAVLGFSFGWSITMAAAKWDGIWLSQSLWIALAALWFYRAGWYRARWQESLALSCEVVRTMNERVTEIVMERESKLAEIRERVSCN